VGKLYLTGGILGIRTLGVYREIILSPSKDDCERVFGLPRHKGSSSTSPECLLLSWCPKITSNLGPCFPREKYEVISGQLLGPNQVRTVQALFGFSNRKRGESSLAPLTDEVHKG
jgi:hypothetical protein